MPSKQFVHRNLINVLANLANFDVPKENIWGIHANKDRPWFSFLDFIFWIHAELLNNISRAKIKRSFDWMTISIFPNFIALACTYMCFNNNISMLQRLHFLNLVGNLFKMQTKVDSRSVSKICESMCFLNERYILLIQFIKIILPCISLQEKVVV